MFLITDRGLVRVLGMKVWSIRTVWSALYMMFVHPRLSVQKHFVAQDEALISTKVHRDEENMIVMPWDVYVTARISW
jgi:hypothetical protein